MDKVLILAKNDSELTIDNKYFISNFKFDIWAAHYTENVKLVGCVSQTNLDKLIEFKNKNNLNFKIISPLKTDHIAITFIEYSGKTTIIELLNEAIQRKIKEIYIISDVLKEYATNSTSNQIIQFKDVLKRYNLKVNIINNNIMVINTENNFIIENLQYKKEKYDNFTFNDNFIDYRNNTHFFKLINDMNNSLKNKFNSKNLYFLILGNDPSINNLNNDLIEKNAKNSKLITVGINRSWRRLNTDILYFLDGDALKELEMNNKKNNNSFWVTSEFIFSNPESIINYYEHKLFIECNNLYILKNPKEQLRKSSVIWIIYYLNLMFSNYNCIFYLYGMSLNIEQGHFWINDKNIIENKIKDQKLLQNFFNSQLLGIKILFNNFKFNLISISKNSKLNEFLPYQEIENLSDFVGEFK